MDSSKPVNYLVLAYAVTPVHVGEGRAPGTVDLPFQRDPIGYPIVYGSSFKGALRSYLERNSVNGADGNFVRCAFGPEPGEEDKYGGRLVFTDLVPAFYPVASLDGYVYVTTEYLRSRVEDIVKALEADTSNLYGETPSTIDVGLLLYNVHVEKVLSLNSNSKIKGLGSLINNVDKIYVLKNDVGLEVVESALIRVTRNIIDDKTKTVKEGGLWTEEYVPHGTVFVGGIIDSGRAKDACGNVNPVNYLGGKEFAMFIGGKETVGKGLIKIKIEATGAPSSR